MPSFFRCSPIPLPDPLLAFLSFRGGRHGLLHVRCRHDRRGALERFQHPEPLKRLGGAACMAHPSLPAVDEERQARRVGGADVHVHRCDRRLNAWSAAQLVEEAPKDASVLWARLSDDPRLSRLPELRQRSSRVALRERTWAPWLPALRRLVLRQQARRRHGDGAWCSRPPRRVRVSARAQE